uniref:Conserved secreted protein n=1 Tax=Steinernema glaseri TaxID=37863 RepID=A0A1I8AA96_9BILA
MKFVLAVPVLLGLVLAQEPTVTFSGEQKIDSCDVSLQGEGAYRTLVTKTQPLCKLSVQAPAGSVILVTVKNKGKNCFKEPSKIFVVDGGKNGQLQCDGRNEEWLTSSTSSIDVVYSPRQPHLISFKFAKKLPCSASIGFNELDQSFLLEGRRGETCLVLVPGRTRVVLERLQLVEEECRSHVQMRTGPHIDELKFSSRLFCAGMEGRQFHAVMGTEPARRTDAG